MKFKVGQTVVLVNNSGMCALKGATAVIENIGNELISVLWKTDSKTQMNGGYYSHHFKPLVTKGQQLLFAFME